MSDDLDNWLSRSGHTARDRAAPGGPRPGGPPPPGGGDYRAWGKLHSDSEFPMLEVRRRCEHGFTAMGELVPLRLYTGATFSDSEHGDFLTLAFADRLITLRGRGLKGLRDELRAGKVDYVQEFDGARGWGEPSEPVITSIEVAGPQTR